MNVYYSGVLGALGGLIAWVLLGAIVQIDSFESHLRSATQGAAIGLLVGAAIGAVEGILNGNPRQLFLGVQRSAAFGLIGGAAGLLLGELALQVMGGGFVARAAGWALFGAAIGVGEGQAHRSRRKSVYGAVGGAAGGALGGLLLEALAQQGLEAQSVTRGLGLVLLGGCVGILLALVSEALMRGRLKILSGRREGREYSLDRAETSLGSSDGCDVYLPGDPAIHQTHAMVRRVGRALTIAPLGDGTLRVNGASLRSNASLPLKGGEQIEIGTTRMLFQAARAGSKP